MAQQQIGTAEEDQLSHRKYPVQIPKLKTKPKQNKKNPNNRKGDKTHMGHDGKFKYTFKYTYN